MVKLLIDHNADVNFTDSYEGTLMHEAACVGNKQIFELIVPQFKWVCVYFESAFFVHCMFDLHTYK